MNLYLLDHLIEICVIERSDTKFVRGILDIYFDSPLYLHPLLDVLSYPNHMNNKSCCYLSSMRVYKQPTFLLSKSSNSFLSMNQRASLVTLY